MDTSPTQHRPLPPAAYRTAWLTVVSVVTLLGGSVMLLTCGPTVSLLVLGTFGGLGAVFGAGLAAAVPDAQHPVITCATASTCVAVAGFGVSLAPWVVGPAALILVAASPPVIRLAARVTTSLQPIRPACGYADTRTAFTAHLATLDPDELLGIWETSAVALTRARGPQALNDVVAVRQLCLDELERRAPETFALWMLTQYPS